MKSLVPVALALVFCAACASVEPPSVPAHGVSFSTFSLTESSVFEKTELRVRIDLPYVAADGNAEAARRINAEILRTALSACGNATNAAGAENFANGIRRFVADEVKNFRARQTEIYTAGEEPVCTENEISIAGTVRRATPELLVYEIRTVQFFGGAHPSHELHVLNFDPRTGTRITLRDIFKPGSEPELAKILEREAAKNADVPANGFFPKPAPHENFAIEPDGVVFIFNPYEIAPYSSGTIMLKVPLFLP